MRFDIANGMRVSGEFFSNAKKIATHAHFGRCNLKVCANSTSALIYKNLNMM